MRIALLSTCAVSVPPRAYGGSELVVAELAKMLTRLGHEVVVFASGDSTPAAAPRGRLVVRNPRLPKNVRKLELHGMRIGSSLVSVRFRRVGSRCHVDRLDVTGGPLKTEIEID
jgi:hypothetical protein